MWQLICCLKSITSFKEVGGGKYSSLSPGGITNVGGGKAEMGGPESAEVKRAAEVKEVFPRYGAGSGLCHEYSGNAAGQSPSWNSCGSSKLPSPGSPPPSWALSTGASTHLSVFLGRTQDVGNSWSRSSPLGWGVKSRGADRHQTLVSGCVGPSGAFH